MSANRDLRSIELLKGTHIISCDIVAAMFVLKFETFK